MLISYLYPFSAESQCFTLNMATSPAAHSEIQACQWILGMNLELFLCTSWFCKLWPWSASSLGAPLGRALIFLLTSQGQPVWRLSHWNRPKVCAMWRRAVPCYQKDPGRILGIALMLHKFVISPDPWKLGGKLLASSHVSQEADSTYVFLVSSPTGFAASSVSSYVQPWLFFRCPTCETERIRIQLRSRTGLKTEARPHFPGAGGLWVVWRAVWALGSIIQTGTDGKLKEPSWGTSNRFWHMVSEDSINNHCHVGRGQCCPSLTESGSQSPPGQSLEHMWQEEDKGSWWLSSMSQLLCGVLYDRGARFLSRGTTRGATC